MATAIDQKLIAISDLTEGERAMFSCWQVLEDEDYLNLLQQSLRQRQAIGPTDTIGLAEFLDVEPNGL